MNRDFSSGRLDPAAFAAAGDTLEGTDPVTRYPRLAGELVEVAGAADTAGAAQVVWQADGEERRGAAVTQVPWMHLTAEADVSLVCQRCLTPVSTPLRVDRWFRFVADEATAEAEDESSDEEVLAIDHEFDLHALIEDELLLALPITPVHETCPVPVTLSAVDAGFDADDAARRSPFAVLESLRGGKADGG